jgi:hypothetical protein
VGEDGASVQGVDKYPKLDHKQRVNHLGTLGTGNHFIEACLDENENVWFLLHSIASAATANSIDCRRASDAVRTSECCAGCKSVKMTKQKLEGLGSGQG